MLPLRRRLHDDGAVSAAYLRLIPTEPTFVPSADHREGAVALVVAQLPNAREVTFRLTERVQLVDCGGNFEEVRCPKCGAPLEIEAWQDAMSQAYDGEGFGDLSYQTECCGHPTTLNDLDSASRWASHAPASSSVILGPSFPRASLPSSSRCSAASYASSTPIAEPSR